MSYSAPFLADIPDQDRTQVAAPTGMSPMVLLLVGYMWLFIHRPFEIWPVLATLRIERVYMILTIVCWLMSNPRLSVPNRLHFRFFLFVVVMLVSWLLSPYTACGTPWMEDYLKFGVFYVLFVTSLRNERDLFAILAGYVGVMTLLMTHSLREFFCGAAWYAQGMIRMRAVGATFDANDFAGLIVCCLPFAWVLWREWTARWKRVLLLAHVALACYCVMLTGSRMGFIGVVLASVLACLTSPKRWRLLALYPVLLAAVWMLIPEDRKDRYLTLIDPTRGPANAAASAGNLRYAGFEKSLPLFIERPLLGFGPMGFRAVNGMMPHNLYGQLLAELGLAGAVAFGSIVLGVGQNLLEAQRIVRENGRTCDTLPWRTVAAATAAFFLLLIMAWGFNFLYWHVWLWFGGFQAIALQYLKEQSAMTQPSDSLAMEPQSGVLETRWL